MAVYLSANCVWNPLFPASSRALAIVSKDAYFSNSLKFSEPGSQSSRRGSRISLDPKHQTAQIPWIFHPEYQRVRSVKQFAKECSSELRPDCVHVTARTGCQDAIRIHVHIPEVLTLN